MAMAKCKECKHDISTDAKTCPNCGIKNPYKKKWEDMPAWQQNSSMAILAVIALIVLNYYGTREGKLYQKITSMDDSQYQEKYEGYLRLHEINGKKYEYKENAIKYAKLYLKKLPVTKPEANLSVYKALSDLDSKGNYSKKIDIYTFMKDISMTCAINSQDMSMKSLKNKSTYENILLSGSGGSWLNKSTYEYTDIFEGKNDFGVTQQFKAVYLCRINLNSKRYSLSRVSFVRN